MVVVLYALCKLLAGGGIFGLQNFFSSWLIIAEQGLLVLDQLLAAVIVYAIVSELAG